MNYIYYLVLLTFATTISDQLGLIDVEVYEASLFFPANAYATVCIQNTTSLMIVPTEDIYPCYYCSTKISRYSRRPMWNHVCIDTRSEQYNRKAHITVDLWLHNSKENSTDVNIGRNRFTIQQLLYNGDNRQIMGLPLYNGYYSSYIYLRITWTPIIELDIENKLAV